jgi:serine/threonine protein kinase
MNPETIGRYEVVSELGRGGMATVYQAHDPNFDRTVAVKVLPREFLHDPTFRERFEREAKTIAALEHPAIVPVYDYGEDGGLLYLVMRHMPGRSLEDRIKEGALPVADAARILKRIGAALDEAHQHGIIHRDLKPGNVLFDSRGDAYLSDFGIAKLAAAGASLTGTGIIGTPAYMSPEQARGEKDLDARSDLYALGVILFEMLTGQQPYESDTPMGVAVKHILDPVPEILAVKPDLPDDVEPVVSRALAKDRDDRYATAADMAEALSFVARGKPLPDDYRPLPAKEVEQVEKAEQAGKADAAATEALEGLPPVSVPSPPAFPRIMDRDTDTPVVPSAPPAPSPGGAMSGAVAEAVAEAVVEAPPTAEPTTETPEPTERGGIKERVIEKRRHGLPTGCIVVLVVVVLIAFGGVSKARRLSGMLPGLPFFSPSDLASEARDISEMAGLTESTGEIVTHDIAQELGDIDELDVRIDLGATKTVVETTDEDGYAAYGDYTADAAREPLDVVYEARGARGVLNISQEDPALFVLGDDPLGELYLGLTTAVPINLTVSSGLGEMDIDLSELTLNSLTIEGGAGRTWVKLPDRGDLDIRIMGGAGEVIVEAPDDSSELNLRSLTVKGGLGSLSVELPDQGVYDVRVEVGFGEIVIEVPDDLEARIDFEGGIANLTMVNDRFVKVEDEIWQTEDYVDAVNRALIDVVAGMGDVRIED